MPTKTTAGKPGRARKTSDTPRLVDVTLDGTLDTWPAPPPKPPRTPVEHTRLVLIQTPGQVHCLAGSFSDVGRASKIASQFRRAKPVRLDPTATGRFDARAFYDPTEHRWRVAARYLPDTSDQPDNSPEP